MIVTHGKLYDFCTACGKLVRINKPIVGSLHVCSGRRHKEEEESRPIIGLHVHRLIGRYYGTSLNDSEEAYLHSLGLRQCDECCVVFRESKLTQNPQECVTGSDDEDIWLCISCIPDVVANIKRQKVRHPEWYKDV